MKSFYHHLQLSSSWRPQLTLAFLALLGSTTGPATVRTLAAVSAELARIFLSLCQMGLVVLRVCGV